MSATEKQIKWLKGLPHYSYMKKRLGPYRDEKDYVGAEGDWKAKYIPRSILGVDVNVYCYEHDYFFVVGGSRTDKNKADGLMLLNIIHAIRHSRLGWFKKFRAVARACGYCIAIQKYGDAAFNFKEDDR